MKKALVICKETYTYPMVYITKELINRGVEVEALFIHSTELILDDPSYTSYVSLNKDITVHSFVDEFNIYIENERNVTEHLDYEYLEYIEEKYCSDIPLSLLQVSSQIFTTPYHYRFYFNKMDENHKLYWIQLLFKKIEKITLNGGFDIVCDLDIAEFGRSALHQVCQNIHIPYVSLEFSRYEDFVLPTKNLGRKTDEFFKNRYNQNLNSEIETEYFDLVNEFYNKDSLMLDSYKVNNTSKIKSQSLFKDLKRVSAYVKYISSTIPKWYPYRHAPPLANPFKAILFFFQWFIRERYLLSANNKYFTSIDLSEKYVYFPLHLIPESTTLNKSPFYPNELSVIEAISKALPVGWKLYVKEHGAMIGERPISFYKKISKLTNIRLVRLDCYDDPKPWILNSEGVITLSGTSAFEASFCGKPSIMFGNTFFEVLDNVIKINSFEELPFHINNFKNYKQSNISSQAAYLKTIKEFGKKIPILALMRDAETCSLNNKLLSVESNRYIKDIVDLYEGVI